MEKKVKIENNKMGENPTSLAAVHTHTHTHTHRYSRKEEIRIRGKPP